MQLETTRLGQSGLEITRVGIGTAPIGSNPSWSIYWGPQLAWSPLASGFLTGDFDLDSLDAQDFRRRHPYAEAQTYTRLKRVREMLQAIAQDHHKKLTDLAIAWVLRQPALTGAIIGIRSEREAQEMAGGVNWKLTGQEIQAIEQALVLWA